MCEEKIGKIIIPEKKNTWSEEVTYKPLSEYVGERFNCSLQKEMIEMDALQAIPVIENYQLPIFLRDSIWKRNLKEGRNPDCKC